MTAKFSGLLRRRLLFCAPVNIMICNRNIAFFQPPVSIINASKVQLYHNRRINFYFIRIHSCLCRMNPYLSLSIDMHSGNQKKRRSDISVGNTAWKCIFVGNKRWGVYCSFCNSLGNVVSLHYFARRVCGFVMFYLLICFIFKDLIHEFHSCQSVPWKFPFSNIWKLSHEL